MKAETFACLFMHMLVFLSACQYDMVGPEGIVESHQITRDGKAGAAEAVDCKWYIRAPPRSKVSAINCCPIKCNFGLKLCEVKKKKHRKVINKAKKKQAETNFVLFLQDEGLHQDALIQYVRLFAAVSINM